MSKSVFEAIVLALGIAFAIAFTVIVVPPLLQSGDVIGAFAAGFVNPFSSGYSLDAIFCGLILLVWVVHDRQSLGIKHGWVVIPLSFVPGVATGFAVYLILRLRQLDQTKTQSGAS